MSLSYGQNNEDGKSVNTLFRFAAPVPGDGNKMEGNPTTTMRPCHAIAIPPARLFDPLVFMPVPGIQFVLAKKEEEAEEEEGDSLFPDP
ncbi:GD15805 [Drosophila simulans]|uniref:GD15805 n=1 Tax=Drosophila simulans TaxID=7240 RepID=B4R569_DROSI|nr:GD15805 [Drosophila simulans]